MQVCIDNITRIFYDDSTSVLSCLAQCPIECHLVEYSLSSSHAEYPTDAYKRILKDFLTTPTISNNPELFNVSNITELEKKILSVNVFYKVSVLSFY